MSHLQFSDREVERVLAGQQPYGRPELAEVAYFVTRLRTLADFERTPEMSPELRAQLEADGARQAQVRPADGRRSAVTRPDPSSGTGDFELVSMDARRTRTARRRWQKVGAAAAAVLVGGVITAGLQSVGGDPEVEVDRGVESPEVGDGPTSIVDEPEPEATEPPAASPGQAPGRPDGVPSDPPDTQVQTETSLPAAPPAEDPAADGSDVTNWVEDFWPRQCEWGDLACACDRWDRDPHSEGCWGYENDPAPDSGP